MMNHLPTYIGWLFGLTTLTTTWLFYRASLRNRKLILLIAAWLLLQGIVAATGFYTVTTGNPPRFLLLVMPPLLLVVVLFASNQGRRWLDRLHPGQLTLLHTIRIPVELVLYALYLHQTVPQLMTFEGRNWDILSGITAPFVYYFGYVKKQDTCALVIVVEYMLPVAITQYRCTRRAICPFPFSATSF